MSCSQCQGIEQIFDSKVAKRELAHYHKKGVSKSTQWLLDSIKRLGKTGLTLMDVGGGVGIIQHELMKAGVAETAVHVDAATSYLQVSQEEAQRLGHAERITYQQGDFVDLAGTLEPADLVTLDRVLCCYHDMPALLNAAASRAQQAIALVFPRDDKLWQRFWPHISNGWLQLTGNPFRLFVHSTTAVDSLLSHQGYQRQMHKQFFFWQSMIYVKSDAA